MCLHEFQELVNDARLINEELVAREIDIFFNLSMMTQIDELKTDRWI
jgi:hypothetical protein